MVYIEKKVKLIKKPFTSFRTCRTSHASRQIISKISKNMLGDVNKVNEDGDI